MIAGIAIYGICFGIGKIVNVDWINTSTCLVPVFVAGATKELYDYKHPDHHSVEAADFGATIALPIAIAGSIVIYRW